MLSLFAGAGLSLSAQGTMRADGINAKIVCTGAPFVVLNNMHFANNAATAMLVPATSEFRFVGGLTTNITSTGPFNTTFYNTEINKPTGEIDVLTNTMTITTSNILEMVQGNVDMNTLLASTWQLGTSTAVLGTLTRTAGHFYNGYFQRWYSIGSPGADIAQWDIPVGMNATWYNYARVYYPSSAAGGTLRTRFVPTAPFYNGMPMVDATNTAACGASVNINNCANEGYWDVIAGNGIDATSAYTIKLSYTNITTVNTPPCLRIIKSENLTSWMQEGTHGSVDAVNLWVTRTGQTGYSFFTIGGNFAANPLPVELSAFNANCRTNSILINWTTASENNNDYFVLERSKDLITWDMVTTINTLNGNSNITQQYSYVDHIFGGTFYYRLTQVDINGTAETYPPVSLTCIGTEADPSIVNLYQNGDGQVTIVLFAPGEMDYVLHLYDLHGKAISIANGMLTGGNNTFTLDAHLLRDAFYLVNVEVGDKSLSKKIFVK